MVNADPKTLPDDERMVMNLMFLKYATAVEIQNLVKPFLGEGAYVSVYEPANLLLIEDNARSMKRTMDLIALFDSDSSPASACVCSKWRTAVRAICRRSWIRSSRPMRFRIRPRVRSNSFRWTASIRSSRWRPIPEFLRKWKAGSQVGYRRQGLFAGSVNSYVYRLKYARAETVAMAIMALYSGNPFALMALGADGKPAEHERGQRHGRHRR